MSVSQFDSQISLVGCKYFKKVHTHNLIALKFLICINEKGSQLLERTVL